MQASKGHSPTGGGRIMTSQDIKRKHARKGHSPTAEGRGWNWSNTERKDNSKGHLLSGKRRGWDWSECRMKAWEGHSLPEEDRGWGWSGHGLKVSQQEALTSWRGQRLRLVRTQKGSKVSRDTHWLEGVEVRTGQNTKRQHASEGQSPTGKSSSQERSEHKRKASC